MARLTLIFEDVVEEGKKTCIPVGSRVRPRSPKPRRRNSPPGRTYFWPMSPMRLSNGTPNRQP